MSIREVPAEFLFICGIILIFLGVFVIFFGLLPTDHVEGAGVIIIGPFPIIFQGEINSFILLAIILISMLLFIMVIFGIMRKFIERRVGEK